MRRLMVLVALAALAAPPVGAARAAEPFTIDVIIPETGAAAFLGKEEAQALGAIETLVNKTGGIRGRPVRFAILDDQSSPQVSVQLLNGVMAKKPAVVLGSSFTATCGAMSPLVEKSGPVMYCFSPGIHPAAGTYVFSATPSTTDLLAVTAKYFHAQGWTKVGIITSTDATGQDAERGIDGAFEAPGSGETIVDREHFNTADVSTTAQMTRLAASGAQAVIAWSTGTPFATVLRGASDTGLTIPMLTTSGNLTYAQMNAYAGFMSKALYFPAFPWVAPDSIHDPAVRRAVDTFVGAFKADGVRPDIGQSLGWDATLLVIDAFRHLGTNATAAQVREYLDAVGPGHPFTGIYGSYDFKAYPQRGLAGEDVVMCRWDPQKQSWVAASAPGGAPLHR